MKFCVVGAGFSGAIIARHLSETGHHVVILDERSHIAGNCHTLRDDQSGIMLHNYGPHIFHTANRKTWEYIQKFGVFRPYINRVKAISQGRIYTLPINLLTINQFFDKTMSPKEAKDYIKEKANKNIKEPKNFEEQALSMFGDELYYAFFTVTHVSNGEWSLENYLLLFSKDFH